MSGTCVFSFHSFSETSAMHWNSLSLKPRSDDRRKPPCESGYRDHRQSPRCEHQTTTPEAPEERQLTKPSRRCPARGRSLTYHTRAGSVPLGIEPVSLNWNELFLSTIPRPSILLGFFGLQTFSISWLLRALQKLEVMPLMVNMPESFISHRPGMQPPNPLSNSIEWSRNCIRQ